MPKKPHEKARTSVREKAGAKRKPANSAAAPASTSDVVAPKEKKVAFATATTSVSASPNPDVAESPTTSSESEEEFGLSARDIPLKLSATLSEAIDRITAGGPTDRPSLLRMLRNAHLLAEAAGTESLHLRGVIRELYGDAEDDVREGQFRNTLRFCKACIFCYSMKGTCACKGDSKRQAKEDEQWE
jgi:hypothetical protein